MSERGMIRTGKGAEHRAQWKPATRFLPCAL